VIIDWPAHGDVSKGQSFYLAPFYDYNADGIYNPRSGDYPVMRGDQAIFFIFNDDRNYHSETEGEPFHAEIQGMAYAFDCPADTALLNSLFFHYDVINRSDHIYHDTYLSIFSDFDIGYANDDFLGCDVERNSVFGYNGRETDGTGQLWAYGDHPPAEALTILGGPWMDADDIDNPKYDLQGNPLCDRSVNGFGFGDSIADNERLGLSNFMTVHSLSWWWEENYWAPDYYNMQRSLWRTDSSLIYGGNGYYQGGGGYGPACRFIFPGHSDTLNWGLGCVPPNGPKEWTEITAGNNPHDVRGVASMGPFTFRPGDKEELDFAYIFARDMNGNNLQSLEKLRTAIDHINFCFQRDSVCTGKTFSSLESREKTFNELRVYPNPATSVIFVEFNGGIDKNAIVSVVDLYGRELITAKKWSGINQLSVDVSGLNPGLYIIAAQTNNHLLTRKVSVIRK
jgi:Secretion system C-terminal sorting domain